MSNNTHSECGVGVSCHPLKQALPSLSQRAFTLIEVLVAMTILMSLILMLTNMFSGASAAANIGNDSAEVNTAGRAALNFMSMKLSQAMGGLMEPPPLSPPSSWSFDLTDGNDVRFYSVTDRAQLRRFYFDGSNLVYYYGITNGVLVENVVDFKIYAYAEEGENLIKGKGDPFNFHSGTSTNHLPYCVDIGIKLLSYRDYKKMQQLSGDNLANFLSRNGCWFTTRVYFQLKQGYTEHTAHDTDSY